jgi:hypothetical protein
VCIDVYRSGHSARYREQRDHCKHRLRRTISGSERDSVLLHSNQASLPSGGHSTSRQSIAPFEISLPSLQSAMQLFSLNSPIRCSNSPTAHSLLLSFSFLFPRDCLIARSPFYPTDLHWDRKAASLLRPLLAFTQSARKRGHECGRESRRVRGNEYERDGSGIRTH